MLDPGEVHVGSTHGLIQRSGSKRVIVWVVLGESVTNTAENLPSFCPFDVNQFFESMQLVDHGLVCSRLKKILE